MACRLIVFTCRRCGFDYETPKGGSPKKWCPECRPLVRLEQMRRYDSQRNRPVEQRALFMDRLSEAFPSYYDMIIHLDRAGLHRVVKGYTPQQWVARWNERPDLFLGLVEAFEDLLQRYPVTFMTEDAA